MQHIVAYYIFQFLVHELQFKHVSVFFHNFALLFMEFRNKINRDMEFKAFLDTEIFYTIKWF